MTNKKYFPNNEINKKKYKKHSMSPFISLDAGNVEHNVAMFNKMAGSGESAAVSEDYEVNNSNQTIDEIIDYLKPGLDWLEDK